MRLAGLEPAAHSLGNCCSIHLSYRRAYLEKNRAYYTIFRLIRHMIGFGINNLRTCCVTWVAQHVLNINQLSAQFLYGRVDVGEKFAYQLRRHGRERYANQTDQHNYARAVIFDQFPA